VGVGSDVALTVEAATLALPGRLLQPILPVLPHNCYGYCQTASLSLKISLLHHYRIYSLSYCPNQIGK